MRRVQQLHYNASPGLASLAGAAGNGFARAGQQIVNLGSAWDKQDTRDAAILAAKKEQEAAQNALRAKNYAANPAMVQKINKQYGISDTLANDVTAPTLANAVLGRVDLGTPKEKKNSIIKEGEALVDGNGREIIRLPKTPKESKPTQKIGNDGYYYNVDSKGVFHKTNVKAPDYWNSSKNDIHPPAGFVDGKTFNEVKMPPAFLEEAQKKNAIFYNPKTKRYMYNKSIIDDMTKVANVKT